MEEAVVGAVVGASIQVLLQNLINMSMEQIILFRDYKHDLEKLKNTFSIVNAFLYDAEKKQVTNMAVRIWLRNLEALAFEAYNVFDEIDYELLSKKVGATRNKTVKKKSPMPSWLKRYRLGRGVHVRYKSAFSSLTWLKRYHLRGINSIVPVEFEEKKSSLVSDGWI